MRSSGSRRCQWGWRWPGWAMRSGLNGEVRLSMCPGARSAAILRAFLMGHEIVFMQATTAACTLQGCEPMCQLGTAFSPVLQQLYKIGSGEAGWLDPDIVELERLEH